MATNVPVTLDTLIVVKVHFQSNTRKFKIPLRDLGAHVLPEKVRLILPRPTEPVIFERYSDSAGAYVTLDSNKPQVYKTLFRAAKAKLKLRLRASVPVQENIPAPVAPAAPAAPIQERPSSQPRSLHRLSCHTLTPQHNAPVEAPVEAPAEAPVEAPADTVPSPVLPPAPKTADAEVLGEAPVPRPFPARHLGFMSAASSNSNLAIRPKIETLQSTWVVYCNNCNLPMEDEHYHCNICDHGDYDLCHSCVDSGIHCPGTNHWMLKRFIKNGKVVNSSTERVKVKPLAQPKPPVEKEMPGSFTEEKQSIEVIDLTREEPTRTCNCCVQVLRETEFVTCTTCEDYDLCLECHLHNKHGHHPGHAFKAATADTTMPALADFLCNAGRNVRHSAVCDGCEKFIYGVRHKCLNCPDWDFCSECVKSSKYIHPGHRFVPIYEPLAEPMSGGNRHYGIYCDGPLCKDKENQSYIEGVRFKCAVCNDTDFCANCEAHPSNRHNHTHPLIKFKRPVRSVSVTTLNEDRNGTSITRVGDHAPARSPSFTESVAAVQTIADVKPTEVQPKTTKEKIEIRDLLSEPVPVQEKFTVQGLLSPPAEIKAVKAEPVSVTKSETALDAHFVRDSILDGSKIGAGQQFVQVWTLQNPGPATWPSGCSVRHVGGDNMLNIDNTQPLSQSELAEASETNVVGRPVTPGEEVSFRVIMKAPAREGTAISYWRLKTAEGMPFGHRLWCDIQVVTPSVQTPPTVESSGPSSSMTPYERFQQAKLERFRSLRTQRLLVKVEREKMLRIQKVRKAAVERLLETRRKEHEAYTALQQQGQGQQEKSREIPVEETIPETKEELQSSCMIFPQLDKESPASSTHEAATTQPQSPQPEPSVPASVSEHSDEEFFEDADTVDIRSLSSDDGFMTDEEYDILDASDEEMP
ncbi:hypothetical protein P280DRAFT_410991 [Massarina eburnea CBS 473.64]|uniref:ZZ-type domain-containing protein n=1 Tax=Massarina eburnea CBS 473.64 TaxID=1395130 RepID=A0A6A6RL24_9PLEO|nr:hypothetical protein P280DRAFT_410991 [Massarina eburnea CBS 473.64]